MSDKTYKRVELARCQNLEATLMQLVGNVQAGTAACKSCQNIAGPFRECIVTDICGRGSCGNCHKNAEGARCSLRPAEKTNKRKHSGMSINSQFPMDS